MSSYTVLPDALLVNDVDLSSLPGVIVENLDGLHAPGTRRGSNDTVPGRAGQLGARLTLDAYTFSIPVTLTPSVFGDAVGRRADMLDTLSQLVRLTQADDGLLTLTRRLATTTGHVDTTANGQLVDGFHIDLLNAETGRTELQFVNLDGCWHDLDATTVSPGSIDVPGTLRTRRIMLDLPSAGTLTNNTTGTAVYVATSCVLDVENYSATSGIGLLESTGTSEGWFSLAPGANSVVWTGSNGVDITYRAAYL